MNTQARYILYVGLTQGNQVYHMVAKLLAGMDFCPMSQTGNAKQIYRQNERSRGFVTMWCKALAKRLDICIAHLLDISHLAECVDIKKIFKCGKTTEQCPVNTSSVIVCIQLLGLFRLKYACANRTMFSRSGKTTDHLTSTSSNERNIILST